VAENLIRETWANLDPHELRLLLNHRIIGCDSERKVNPAKLYFPASGNSCRIVLTYRDKKIVAIEPGPAFDICEWQKIAQEIDSAILAGPQVVGREFSFSRSRVRGSWRGAHSGVQILPAPPEAPVAPYANADHPFILEFPITEASDDLWEITAHRQIREHRRLTLLLNALLKARVSFEPPGHEKFWASVPAAKGSGREVRWVQQFFFAPLVTVQDHLSPPAAESLVEVAPETYYVVRPSPYYGVGPDRGLRVPADLDDSLCLYRDLSKSNRSKFDRAAYWLDIATRLWMMSMSASFASLVSA
jgi:hypothetical protein